MECLKVDEKGEMKDCSMEMWDPEDRLVADTVLSTDKFDECFCPTLPEGMKYIS